MMSELPNTAWPTLSEILKTLPDPIAIHKWKKTSADWYEKQQDGLERYRLVRDACMALAKIKEHPFPTDPRIVQFVTQFYRWSRTFDANVLAIDLPVWSGAYQFRTNLDLLYEKDGEVWLTIITTSKRTALRHHARLAAIRLAIGEMITRGVETEQRLKFPTKMSIVGLKQQWEQGGYVEIISEGNFEAFERAYNAVR